MAFGEVDDECDGPIAVGAVVRVGPLLHGAFGFYEQKVEPIDVDVQTIGVNAIFGYVTE